MKSYIPFLLLSLFVSASALCMEPEQKQEQAQLDAQQFAREQDSKRKSAQANAVATEHQSMQEINNHALESLGKERRNEVQKALDKFLIRHLQAIVMEYDKEGFKNGHQLMAALIPRGRLQLTEYYFHRPDFSFDDYCEATHFIQKFRIVGQIREKTFNISFALAGKKIDLDTQKLGAEKRFKRSGEDDGPLFKKNILKPFELSGEIIDGKLHLNQDHRILDAIDETDLLSQCNNDQIELIRHISKVAKVNGHIILNEEYTELYNTLPQQLQTNLESNFPVSGTTHQNETIVAQLKDYLETAQDMLKAIVSAIRG